MDHPQQARKSRVGRPPRISREAIIVESLSLLQNCTVEQFTLASVARRLGTVSMALYNYFPSREALLAEVANEVCKQFRMPEPIPGQDWKGTLSDWMWTLYALGKRYPMMFKVTGVDGKTSAGWLAIAHVVGETLHGLGFRGRELTLTNWLFCHQVLSLLAMEFGNVNYHSPPALDRLDELEPRQQQFFLVLRSQYAEISSEDVLREGFADLLAAVERRIPTQPGSQADCAGSTPCR